MIRNCLITLLGLATMYVAWLIHVHTIEVARLSLSPPIGTYLSKGPTNYFGRPASEMVDDPWSKLLFAQAVNIERCNFALGGLGLATATLGALGFRRRGQQPQQEQPCDTSAS